jgi:hypothetical protein
MIWELDCRNWRNNVVLKPETNVADSLFEFVHAEEYLQRPEELVEPVTFDEVVLAPYVEV